MQSQKVRKSFLNADTIAAINAEVGEGSIPSLISKSIGLAILRGVILIVVGESVSIIYQNHKLTHWSIWLGCPAIFLLWSLVEVIVIFSMRDLKHRLHVAYKKSNKLSA